MRDRLNAPSHNSSFVQGTRVTFTGTAGDAHDGLISASIGWCSSRDGVPGTGPSVASETLSAGVYSIRAPVTDSGGLSDSSAISITIATPTPRSRSA